MSRCTTPWAWAWASASHRAIPIRTMSRSDSRPSSSSDGQRLAADQLGDQVGALVVDRGLVQGHDPRVRQLCGRPGLALEPAAEIRSRGTILTATSRSRRSSRASQTVPKAPEPRRRRSR